MHEQLDIEKPEMSELKTMMSEIKGKFAHQITEQAKVQTIVNNFDEIKKENRVELSKEQEEKGVQPK